MLQNLLLFFIQLLKFCCQLEPYHCCLRLQCHGKNLFYFFGTGDSAVVMHVHFGMSGAFRTSTRGEEPDARETTRLKLVGKDIVAQLSAMTVAHGGLGAFLRRCPV